MNREHPNKRCHALKFEALIPESEVTGIQFFGGRGDRYAMGEGEKQLAENL